MKIIFQILALAAVIVFALLVLSAAKMFSPQSGSGSASSTGSTSSAAADTDTIVVDSPIPGALVSSPLSFTGKAPGNWYFEAVFPVTVVDWDGRIIGQTQAKATIDWMTQGIIPFIGSVRFTPPACGASQDYCKKGAVIFKNDNPSGDPAKDKALEIPVVFQ